PPSYPTAGLDMAYFYPTLARADGKAIGQAQCMQSIDGKQWQRWSRHYTWLPGVHSVSTHIVLIHRWLEAALA
ncbi:MAG TPA: E2/UBC family protein, partial [Lacunisphaera sp.]|nr:E2/UBC family protein [Lacunisphaera sp.]